MCCPRFRLTDSQPVRILTKEKQHMVSLTTAPRRPGLIIGTHTEANRARQTSRFHVIPTTGVAPEAGISR